jgi:hypothetical protein
MSNAPRQGAGGSASSKILAGAACVGTFASLCGLTAAAHAEEGPVAYPAGVDLGIPIAAAPPRDRNHDAGSVLTVYLQDQLDVVPAVSVGPNQISSRGDKVSEFALGPKVSHNLGFVGVTAYFTRDLIHENTIGGDSVWLRLSARF